MDKEMLSHVEEVFKKAPPEIQLMILGGAVDEATTSLGFVYKIPINLQVNLKNIIVVVLLGLLAPSDVVKTLQRELSVDEVTAYKMGKDLDNSILQQTRMRILGEDLVQGDVKTIKLPSTTSKEELRKQIMSQTEKENAINKSPTEGVEPPKPKPKSGSRDQLIEQLQVLQSITNSEEVEARLNRIREQVASMDVTQEQQRTLTRKAEEGIGQYGDKMIRPKTKVATYSRAPTHYNVDPYRELAED